MGREDGQIDLKQLTYLHKVLESGNITRAAESLGIAQTALGFQIRNLEDELGVTLIQRHSRGVEATEAGELLARYADTIISRIETAKQAVSMVGREKVTPVTLGVTPSVMRLVGDDIVIELQKSIPEVSLRVVEELSFMLGQMMARGELTCALHYGRDIPGDMERRALLEEDLYFITAPDVTPDDGPVPFQEVAAQDLVMTTRRDAVFVAVDAIAKRMNLSLNVAYEVTSIRAMKNIAARGIAGTIMPYGAAEGELRKGELKGRPIISPAITRTLQFVYPREHATLLESAAFQGFIDSIVERMLAARGPVMRRL